MRLLLVQIFDLKGSVRNRMVNTSGKAIEELVLLDENLLKGEVLLDENLLKGEVLLDENLLKGEIIKKLVLLDENAASTRGDRGDFKLLHGLFQR